MNRIGIALVCVASLCACSTTRVGMKYDSSRVQEAFAGQTGTISVGSFIDQRGEPAHWLGAIRGGFGNPVKKIETSETVSALVASAFIDGLRARGIDVTRGSPPLQISGVIRALDCNQMVRREANAEIEISVIELATGHSRFTRTYSASNVEGSIMSLKTGIFASVEELRALAERTLNEVVDEALDDSTLHAALATESPLPSEVRTAGE